MSQQIPSSSADQYSLSQVIQQVSGMDAVESTIRAKLASDAADLTEISSYLLSLGGKRIRPALCILIANACGMNKPSQDLIDVASGIELIHMATLLHDDIIDKSAVRRKKTSPFLRFGLPRTLLTGDFLLVRAFSLCAHLDSFVVEATERACVELTEGEILETPLYSCQHTIESSLGIAKKKTASLFRLAALCAVHLSGGSSQAVTDAAQFGEYLGIAFQILDDILDVTSDEATLGKPIGIDLLERKPSLINVLWLLEGSRESKPLLSQPGDADSEAHFVHTSIQHIRTSPVLSRARAMATDFSDRALKALDHLSKSHACDQTGLATLQFVVRESLQRLQ